MPSLKISPGFNTIEEEFENSIRRAFVDNKADFIYFDSKRQQYLAECINYGFLKNWLDVKFVEIEEQYSRYEAKLTTEGKIHFGLIKTLPHSSSTEVIIGYRKWKIQQWIDGCSEYLLTSMYYFAVWYPGKPMIGIVDSNGVSGIYAFNKLVYCSNYGSVLPDNNTLYLIGEVSLWGKVIKAKYGYRAEFGYPKKLISTNASQNVLNILRRTYGIS